MSEKELMDDIIKACNEEATMSLAAKRVGIPYQTFKRRALKLECWKPNQGGKGTQKLVTLLEDVFSGKKNMRSYNLKNRLIAEGYKKPKCEKCGQGEEWFEEVLVLELDHINGNNKDNRLKNLQILCPNCHSQTPTFRGRNHKNRLTC